MFHATLEYCPLTVQTKVGLKITNATIIHLSKNNADFNSCLLVSSADNLCKQFGPRSGLT